ncbi:MAG TPA: cytochrome P450 [Acidimicrobiales bacterium]|nr:cytochrome P450 [Acidimicrobiales bacterium]
MATPISELDLPTVDIEGLTDRSEIREAVEAARRDHWLARTLFGYMVLRHADVVAILRDRRFHNAVSLLPKMAGVSDPDLMREDRPSILGAEGDEHARLRKLVSPAFTPRAADRYRPFMRQVIEELVDPVAPQGRAEFVADVCEPYPIPIICELLGAPREDWKLFSGWATDIFRIFNGNIAEDLPLIKAARAEINSYMTDLIERRRREPGPDLLTDLIAMEEQGDRLSHEELLMMSEAVLLAGTDTTRNQLGCAVALFTEYPEQWAMLAEDPDLAPRAVEEVMRYLGAVRGTGRFASEDIEYRDVLFPRGTMLFPSFVSGNFDPEAFEDPGTFDITREPGTQHLTFGSGIHFCLGAWLARAELQEALPILARRMPNLRADGEIEWKPPSFGIWGPARLPVAFDPEV